VWTSGGTGDIADYLAFRLARGAPCAKSFATNSAAISPRAPSHANGAENCGYLLTVISVLITLSSAAWCWLMRDGLGPKSVTSTGFVALSRFSKEFYPVLFLSSGFSLRHLVHPPRGSTAASPSMG